MLMILLASAAGVAGGQTRPQDPPEQFLSLATYAVSIPNGATRRWVAAPSWSGVGWDGEWTVAKHASAGFGFGLHDFFDQSDGTTNFVTGSATGEQARDLLVGTLMLTARWFPIAPAGHGPFVGIGAGGVFAEQRFQLGLMPVLMRSATRAAFAPEAGVVVPVVEWVDLVFTARYTVPAASGAFLGGGTRRFSFTTLSVGMAERW
jgi:hypothetical protein